MDITTYGEGTAAEYTEAQEHMFKLTARYHKLCDEEAQVRGDIEDIMKKRSELLSKFPTLSLKPAKEKA